MYKIPVKYVEKSVVLYVSYLGFYAVTSFSRQSS